MPGASLSFRLLMMVCAALWVGAAGPARADPVQTAFERSLMLAADARCGLFDPAVSQALAAGAAQALGAARRSGLAVEAADALQARARARASAVACTSPELALAASRVRTAFAGWVATARMTFSGPAGDWIVDRYPRSLSQGWTLRQDGRVGARRLVFGQTASGPTLVTSFAGGHRPYAVRVLARDPARTARPWLSDQPLPRSAARVVLARSRMAATRELAPSGAEDALAWTFPETLLDQLSALDPRERFTIEFVFSDDSIAVASLGVGDLEAARAFAALGPVRRPGSTRP